MSNPSRKKGTQFESSCVNYLRAHGAETWRKAQHGNQDEGDLSLLTHGREIAVECKCVERMTPKLLAAFRLQTTVEAQRAGADGGVLLTWRPGKGYRWDASPSGERAKSFGENLASMTVETLLRASGATGDVAMDDVVLGTWVTMTLADFALMVTEVSA